MIMYFYINCAWEYEDIKRAGEFTYQLIHEVTNYHYRSCDERLLYKVGGLKRTGKAITKTVKMESLATTGSFMVVLTGLRRGWD